MGRRAWAEPSQVDSWPAAPATEPVTGAAEPPRLPTPAAFEETAPVRSPVAPRSDPTPLAATQLTPPRPTSTVAGVSSAPRRAVPGSRRSRRPPLVAATLVLVLVLALVGTVVYVLGRGTATAIDPPEATAPSAAPRLVTLAPGPGRPAALKSWLQDKGFTCTAEATTDVEGYLCLLSGPSQTTVYVGGGTGGLGRVTMMTPYDPSPISQEVQDQLLSATLGSDADITAAKAVLAGGTLERPVTLTQGPLTIRGSLGRQLIVMTDGWPGLTAPRFGLAPTRFPAVAEQAGYTCATQTGVVECTRSIGQMQLTLSAFTGVEDLRYVRIRVAGTDRAVAQQALTAEAAQILPEIGGTALSDAFRSQASSGAAIAFSGSYLLDYYPPATSGNTVRVTLYVSQTCWTGTALTC